jgi:hypothetical protein
MTTSDAVAYDPPMTTRFRIALILLVLGGGLLVAGFALWLGAGAALLCAGFLMVTLGTALGVS